MNRWLMCAVLGLMAACGEGDIRLGGAEMDTLYGFTLGTLRPEVMSAMAARSLPSECEEGSAGLLLCNYPTPSPADCRPYTLGFQDGRLAIIEHNLCADWAGVPLDTLMRRMEAFGEPARDTTSSGSRTIIWRDEEAQVERALWCYQAASAGDCIVSTALLDAGLDTIFPVPAQ